MKIDRLLSITLMLINRPMVSARELSERYEVSIRTIYRDIDSISAAGIPVTSYQGKKGGFCLIDNYRVDRQLLSLEDMTSIVTALKGVNSSLDNNDIKDTIEKIESLVPHDKLQDAQLRLGRMIIDLSPWGFGGDQRDKSQHIHEAICTHRIISFDYRNLNGQQTTREVEPISLILKGNIWYLYGFCRLRESCRIFRLSRISNIDLTNYTFPDRNIPFRESDFFSSDKREPVQIKLRFRPSARMRVEEFFGDCTQVIDNEGRIIIEVCFPEDEWVYSTLLGYGADCEVLSPAHIREIMKLRLQDALTFYKT